MDLFDADDREALAVFQREAPAPNGLGDARCIRFEFSSRGDRVPGRLLLPADANPAQPAPLVLLQHGIGGSVDAPYMEACAPWVRGGAAVASIDFPLHGERASAKLTEHFIRSLDFDVKGESLSQDAEALWIEFARQSVVDLRRALDVATSMAGVDANRVAYAGFSLGAILGTLLCAADPRPRAAALALAGGGFGPASVDPCTHVASIAPRPILFVNAKNDTRVPRSASEKLYEAAGEPREQQWFDAGHTDLPGVALKAMWEHLRRQLSIEI